MFKGFTAYSHTKGVRAFKTRAHPETHLDKVFPDWDNWVKVRAPSVSHALSHHHQNYEEYKASV